MPSNEDGVVVDPTEWNRNDGFSPGTALLTVAPGLDRGGLRPARRSPTCPTRWPRTPRSWWSTPTRASGWPVWAELDDGVEAGEDRLLYVRPGTNFLEGHRYVVGLRDLVDGDGDAARAVARLPGLPRQPHHRPPGHRGPAGGHGATSSRVLGEAGVDRDDLYLAWDFTVASGRNLSERLLHIRDDAFTDLGEAAPAFAVTDVVQDPEEDRASSTSTAPSRCRST